MLPDTTSKAVTQAKENGASSWLSILPLEDEGFTLNKGEFHDAIRYNKFLKGLPSDCPYVQKFTPDHALNCMRGGVVTMRHNTIRDFEAGLLKQVCNDVETEPPLQPLEGEQPRGLVGGSTRPDIRARRIWRPGQNASFDVRVSPTRVYAKHEAKRSGSRE